MAESEVRVLVSTKGGSSIDEGSGKLIAQDLKEIAEYSDAVVHAFRYFRAPLSGNTEHRFPDRVQM